VRSLGEKKWPYVIGGGSRGCPPTPLFWAKKEKIVEGSRKGKPENSSLPSRVSSRSGSTTSNIKSAVITTFVSREHEMKFQDQ